MSLRAATAHPFDSDVTARHIGRLATRSLVQEVETWPKPGLVSHRDNGAHRDMDADMLCRSAHVLEPWFVALAQAGADGADMGRLRVLGMKAEAAMRAETGGVNTHRGAVFGMGLLAAAAGWRMRSGSSLTLGAIVAARWGNAIRSGPVEMHSHGSQVARRYKAGGAREEAARGMPSIYDIALPALYLARTIAPDDEEAVRVHLCMALMAEVEDSNILYRGGAEALLFTREIARDFLVHGGISHPDWQERVASIHRQFIYRNLSPGGCADLLAMSLFVDQMDA
jgi:triphosphoribosyl-dephospho-CoA synthase